MSLWIRTSRAGIRYTSQTQSVPRRSPRPCPPPPWFSGFWASQFCFFTWFTSSIYNASTSKPTLWMTSFVTWLKAVEAVTIYSFCHVYYMLPLRVFDKFSAKKTIFVLIQCKLLILLLYPSRNDRWGNSLITNGKMSGCSYLIWHFVRYSAHKASTQKSNFRKVW